MRREQLGGRGHMLNIDDFKVAIAATAGLTNWLANIDVLLQLAISVASLTYIVLKIRELLNR